MMKKRKQKLSTEAINQSINSKTKNYHNKKQNYLFFSQQPQQ